MRIPSLVVIELGVPAHFVEFTSISYILVLQSNIRQNLTEKSPVKFRKIELGVPAHFWEFTSISYN